MVKMCYVNIETTVLNNGFSSNWFKPNRGIRQGCPLSGCIFLLVAEVLAQLIRINNTIEGIEVYNEISKIKQFADDATCTVKNWESVSELFNVAKAFKNLSGLNLNENKTLIVYLGPWRRRTENPHNLTIETKSFNLLGIHIGRDLNHQNKSNYETKISKMENIFRVWNTRNLSLLGKILVIKSHGLSNIIYSLSNIEVAQPVIEKIQKMINHFIWGSKYNRIKHSTTIADFESGGIRFPDVKCSKMSLRMPWLGRIWEHQPWNIIINSKLNKYGGLPFLLRCDFDVSFMNDIPTFYREMLQYASNIIMEPNALFTI